MTRTSKLLRDLLWYYHFAQGIRMYFLMRTTKSYAGREVNCCATAKRTKLRFHMRNDVTMCNVATF